MLAATLAAGSARAELGGTIAGVRTDASQMNARMLSVVTTGFTRHDMTRANGGTVSEFTNSADKVFAVTWSGPGKPDLRSLLGRYFTTFQGASVGSAARGRMTHSLRRPVQVAQGDLQIQTGGHMGWFHGIAFVPSLAPQGFSPDELSQQP
jgi:hypothetical protein